MNSCLLIRRRWVSRQLFFCRLDGPGIRHPRITVFPMDCRQKQAEMRNVICLRGNTGRNSCSARVMCLISRMRYPKLGAVIIGELKFGVECDSPEMQKIYQLAQAYNVPVLMHWQHKMYNYGFERFYKMLEKYPKVNFIGHAQTWWANIDKDLKDPSDLYPKGPVTPGGIT